MPELLVNVGVELWFSSLLSNQDKDQLTTDIENFIRAAFRENQAYEPTKVKSYSLFSFAVLAQEILNHFPGQLRSISFSNSDLVSSLNIPALETLTVTRHD